MTEQDLSGIEKVYAPKKAARLSPHEFRAILLGMVGAGVILGVTYLLASLVISGAGRLLGL